jgi:hypothetical protein
MGPTNGTFGIWIRFEFVDASFANRIFWDPLAVTEFTQTIATRKVANWGMTVGFDAATPPGPEWCRVGTAVIAGELKASTVATAAPLNSTENVHIVLNSDRVRPYRMKKDL